jgi:lipopolysaccharide/colanic/teichoic acid biosynthesis glycosyltransferase
MRYVPRYSPRQRKRLDARPGITGWAQIHGRNAVDWPERLEYDVQYVEFLDHGWAPILDLGIVAVTVFQVVSQAVTGAGISSPGVATMREFQP